MSTRLLLVLATALGGVVACASIAGLDSSADPIGGAGTSSSSGSTSGASSLDGGKVTGDGSIETAEGIKITPATLAFKFNCGATSTAEITIENTTDTPQLYEVVIAANENFSLVGAPAGEVAARQKTALVVEAKGAAPGQISTDIRVKAGSTEASIDVGGEVRGAALRITPPTVDFGLVRANVSSAPFTATFVNDGNETVSISGFSGGGNDFIVPQNLDIQPGGMTTGDFVLKAGPASAPLNATVTPVVTSKLCGAPPSVALTGRRANDEVTVTPTTLDFGNTDCNAANPTRELKVTVANYVNAPTNYTATLDPSSRFRIVSASGTAPAGDGAQTAGTSDIVLAVKAPGGAFGDANEILTVTPAGKPAVQVKLRTVLYGASFAFNSPTINLSAQGRNSVPLKNLGNASICVNYTYSGSSTMYTESDGDVFGAGFVGDVGVYFYTFDSSPHTGTVGIVRARCPGGGNTDSVPLCTPFPTLGVTSERD